MIYIDMNLLQIDPLLLWGGMVAGIIIWNLIDPEKKQ